MNCTDFQAADLSVEHPNLSKNLATIETLLESRWKRGPPPSNLVLQADEQPPLDPRGWLFAAERGA